MVEIRGLDAVRKIVENTTNVSAYNALLYNIANVVLTTIQTKTAAGFDYLNGKFQPYTEVYKKFKIKRGYSGDVNLRLSGQMMDNLKVITRDNQVIIGFDDAVAEKKARYNQTGRVPRHFVGIGPDLDKQITKMIDEFVNKLMGM